jgi:hypothetical protein
MLNLSDSTLDDNALAGSLRDAPQKSQLLGTAMLNAIDCSVVVVQYHGHFTTSALLAVKTVVRWYPQLKANEEESLRTRLVLSGSEKITKKMRLVDAESARDLFLLHAQQLRQHRRDWQRQQRAASAAPQLKDAVASAASSVALQQPSQLLELCLAFLHEADDDEATILALAKVLCTPDGHGRVSLHQITAFLRRYTDKPTVVEEESDCEQETEQKEKEKEKKEVAADTQKKKEKEEETEAEAESEGGDGEDSVSSSSTAKWKGRVQQRRCSTSRLTYTKCHAQPSSSLPQRPSPSQPM